MGSYAARDLQAEVDISGAVRPNRSRQFSMEVLRLLRCIHENLFDPELSVKSLKVRCRLRDNNISSRFKWETGSYLNDYIETRRLEAAIALLGRDELSVAEAAHNVGYRHLQTFYRTFRRRYGCTPGVFRARLRAAATLVDRADMSPGRMEDE
jgi:AraC-like DNA-binding protein